MAVHEFTLVLQGDLTDDALDSLFEAGCDDATFGEVDGVPYGDFNREAKTFAQAIISAIRAVETVPGLRVRHVEPDDLVTLAEIGERLKVSREYARLLAKGERGEGGFPAAVSHLRARSRLWRWSDVAEWAGLADEDEIDRARVVAAINAVLEARRLEPTLSEEDRALVGTLRKDAVRELATV